MNSSDEFTHRTLVVDDIAVIRPALVELFTSENHNVDQASNTREAWSLIQCTDYDYVVIDIHGSSSDELELLRHIRTCSKRLITIVLATGSHPEIEAMADSPDEAVILLKPRSPAAVADEIRRAIAL